MISDDYAKYRTCMEKVRHRCGIIERLEASPLPPPNDDFLTTELIFVQFRKVLELIAYASLAANKEKYAAADSRYHLHWRAKDMLDDVEKVNPGFYPMPVLPPVKKADGTLYFARPTSAYLAKDDFVTLYDLASGVLHMRNPFSQKPIAASTYTVTAWRKMIEVLLSTHFVVFPDRSRWLVSIPAQGEITLAMAQPMNLPKSKGESDKDSEK